MAVNVTRPAAQLPNMQTDAEATGGGIVRGKARKLFLNCERIGERVRDAVEDDKHPVARRFDELAAPLAAVLRENIETTRHELEGGILARRGQPAVLCQVGEQDGLQNRRVGTRHLGPKCAPPL
jgi:hypothetical protein